MQQNDTLEAIVKVSTNVLNAAPDLRAHYAALTVLPGFHRTPTVIIQSPSSVLYRQPGEGPQTHSRTLSLYNRMFVIHDGLTLVSLLFQKTALERQKPPHRRLDKVWYPAHFSQMPGEERQVRRGAAGMQN